MKINHLLKIFYQFSLIAIIISSCTSPSIMVTREQQKGDYHHNNNQYKKAISHYTACLEASAKSGTFRNLDMEANVYRKMAHGHSALGNYDSALVFAKLALARDSIQNNSLEIVKDIRLIGNIYLYTGDYANGIEKLETAVDSGKNLNQSLKSIHQQAFADIYLSLSRVYSTLGQLNKAFKHLAIAEEIYENTMDETGLMEVWLTRGNMETNKGNLKEAVSFFQKSLEIAKKYGLNTSRHHLAMGSAYKLLAEYEKSIQQKMIALDEAVKSNILSQIIWSRISLGDSYAALGDHDKAESFYYKARQLKDSTSIIAQALEASTEMRFGRYKSAQEYYGIVNDQISSALLWIKIGQAKTESGKLEEAITPYNNALALFTEASVQEGEATAHLNLGKVYIDLDQLEKAIKHIHASMELTRSDETRWESLYLKGLYHEKKSNIDSAITNHKESIEIIENIRARIKVEEYKTTYVEDKLKVYDHLIRLLLGKGDYTSAFKYTERARARTFLDMLANKNIVVQSRSEPEMVEKIENLNLKLQALTKLHYEELMGTRSIAPGMNIHEEIIKGRQEYDQLLEKIKLKDYGYASTISVTPHELKDIQKTLDDTTLLLSYWVAEDYIATWVIQKQNLHAHISKTEASKTFSSISGNNEIKIERNIEFRGRGTQLLNELTRSMGSLTQSDEQYKQMYELLLAPVEKHMAGCTRIGIIPHKHLHFYPFQALQNADGSRLIEKYAIFYIPSGSVFVMNHQKQLEAKRELMAMGLGNLDIGNFSGLPGSEKEIKQVSTYFRDKEVKLEDESSERFFKEFAGDFNYLHLATHGLLDSRQPMYSYVLLNSSDDEDGQLTAGEIMNLKLNANLVVLSACQTGLGALSNGDDLVGLSRSFLYAGSKSVIVTLWNVADGPTAILMNSFYKYLQEKRPEESLRLAQLELMNTYPDPRYWAPFKIIGLAK